MRTIFAAFLLLAGALPALAGGSFADGVAAIEKGDFAAAVEIFRPLAEKGDVAAQYNMGLAYANGRGVTRDDAAAVGWLARAAAADYARAERLLAVMKTYGRGTPADPKGAAELLAKAAAHGDADAQFHLGDAYLAGRGVDKDAARAVKLFRRSALQGDANAQVALAGALADGAGTSADLAEACYWLTLASRTMPQGRPRDLVLGLRKLLAEKAGGSALADAEKKADAFEAAPDPDAVPEGGLAEPPPTAAPEGPKPDETGAAPDGKT